MRRHSVHPRKTEAGGCLGGSLRRRQQPPTRRIVKSRRRGFRTRESFADTGEKFAICFINEESKTPNPMISEEQVAQGVKISVRIVIANPKNDEFNTIHNDVQLKKPTGENGISNKTYIHGSNRNWPYKDASNNVSGKHRGRSIFN